MKRHFFTVGHSNHSIDRFLSLLSMHHVSTVADVRSAPYSRFAPWFNREALQPALNDVGIQYTFMGRELGARSKDPSCYENGRVQYERLAQTGAFREGLDRLTTASDRQSVAIMCAEKDPLECHRTILVARALVAQGSAVIHILAEGSLESFEDSMLRLLDKTRQPPPDLFSTQDERIDRALRAQEERIAYVDKELAAPVKGTPS